MLVAQLLEVMALATLAILTFIGSWNDFLGPLVFLDSVERYTLPVGVALFQGSYVNEYGLTLAASVVCDPARYCAAAEEAFGRAARRLCLTGTPFRTKADERIPFVRYEEDSFEGDDGEGGIGLVSRADYTYGYKEALADSVVRPVVFAAYTGTAPVEFSSGGRTTHRLSRRGNRRLNVVIALNYGSRFEITEVSEVLERVLGEAGPKSGSTGPRSRLSISTRPQRARGS